MTEIGTCVLYQRELATTEAKKSGRNKQSQLMNRVHGIVSFAVQWKIMNEYFSFV